MGVKETSLFPTAGSGREWAWGASSSILLETVRQLGRLIASLNSVGRPNSLRDPFTVWV